MNSLTFLSRHFDSLVLNGRQNLTSTAGETSSHLNANNDSNGSESELKRTQSFSSHSSLITSDRNHESLDRNRKRSCSVPSQPRSPVIIDTHNKITLTIHNSRFRNPYLGKRTFLSRILTYLYGWLATTWSSLMRSNLGFATVKEELTNHDEKDSSDEKSRLDVQEQPSITASQQQHHSPITASPLSQSIVPPIVNLIPPDPPQSSEPLRSSSPSLFPNFSRASSPANSNDAVPSSAPSAPKTPFHMPKTLVLDLDETLIHSTTRPLFPPRSPAFGFLRGFVLGKKSKRTAHVVEVVLGGKSTSYHVYKRPFADYFLRKVSGWYTLVVFTASMQEYADPVIDWLDAGRGILARRLFRDSCTQLPNGSYMKDLSIVDEDLSRICLVDNSPLSYSKNQANGIPIEGWTQDPADEALLDLLPVLDSLRFTSDVRRVLGIRGFS